MKPMNGQPANPEKPDAFRVLHRRGVMKVLDALNRPVEGIIGVDMALRPGQPPLMRMNLAAGAFEVEGVPKFVVFDPKTQKIRPVARIVWEDGEDDFVPAVAMPPPVVSAAPPEAPAAPQPETPTTSPANAPETDTPVQATDGGAAGQGSE